MIGTQNAVTDRYCRDTVETPQQPPTGNAVPEVFVPLDIPVPPNAARVFGYPAWARHVAFYWEPAGDELCYDDGRMAGTGEWHPFLQYRSHPSVAPLLTSWNIGYSDEEADHWLVLDNQAARAWVASIAEAREFLASQHSRLPALRMADVPRIREEIRLIVSQRAVTADDMREMQRQQHERLGRLLGFCDMWRNG